MIELRKRTAHKINGYRCNRSWGDGRLEAFYWSFIRSKSFGSIIDPTDYPESSFLSVEETNKFIKEMLEDNNE